MKNSTAVVIGAGVIGSAVAHELQKRLGNVTLVERDEPGCGASKGNLASIAVTEFTPISRPSTWLSIPGWLLNPKSPVKIKPSHVPRLIPWIWQFILSGRPSKFRYLEANGAALCRRALHDTKKLMGEIGLANDISDAGCMAIYATEREFHSDRSRLEAIKSYGFPIDIIDGRELHDLEPEIVPGIFKAARLPENKTVRDPYLYVKKLAETFTKNGGRILKDAVADLDMRDGGATVRLQSGQALDADIAVLCAGAHSGKLAKKLGEPIPLETERGYHTQIMAPGIDLGHSLIWPSRAFMVSPTAGGIRVGGTVEMAGLNTAPDYGRARITLRHARKLLPRLRSENSTEWMGHRPALPDTVPLISASSRVPGVFYATGHGHLGLTQAATTALLICDLALGRRPDIDMSAFSIDRFSW